jgi:F-type H+-transporting ATPase subunit gamma
MAGLKEIRTRIVTVKTTRQVTSAMKMVSAAKLKKAQDAIFQIRPYAEKIHDIMESLSSNINASGECVYTQPQDSEKVLIVLISSNRGLCGSFNANIAKKAIEWVDTHYQLHHHLNDVDFFCIGKQGERQVKQRGMNVVESHHEIYDTFDREHIYPLAEKIMKFFVAGKYGRVDLIYNRFLNAAVHKSNAEQFLPVKTEKPKNLDFYYDYIFEPSKDEIIQQLIPMSLKIQFLKVLFESNASEQGARMTAMHQATDNATELLRDLTLTYNKLRQTSITSEILEIVSGAEALKGQ